jgi:hypothetical protein
MKKLLSALLFILSGALLSSPVALGQGSTSLRGQVVDEVGAVIPGATVTLTAVDGPQAGNPRTTVANAAGEFVLSNLQPGIYLLTVEFNGFQPFVQSDLKLPLSESLKITLAVKAVEIQTDVQAELNTVNTDPDQNQNGVTLNEEFIKANLPDNEDDLRDYLQALAGPAAGGATGGQGGAQIMVNGFSASRLPPKEAIMQIKINQNPFSAEYSQMGFGRVEIITKPGNEQWRGSFGMNFRNSALDARNAFALIKPEVEQQRYNFNFGGPLIKKKMSFFAFFDRTNLDGASTTNAVTLAGPFVANVAAPFHNTFFGIRTDYLVTQKNTLGVNFNRSQRESLNQEFMVRFGGGPGGFGGGGFGGGGRGGGGASGVTNFTLPERGTDNTGTSNDLQLFNTTILSSTLINEARLRVGYDTSNSRARTDGVAINVLDAFNGGGSTSGLSNSRTFDYELQNYLTWSLKKHTIKGGVQAQYIRRNDFSASNFNGTYTFPNLCVYRNITTGTTDICPPGRFQFTANVGDPRLKYSQTESSWFFNDDWRLRQSLTLSFGFRHEFQTNLGDKINFAPRLGLAWSPFKDRKTTIRGGGGIFYQRLNETIFAQSLRFNGLKQQSIVIENPVFAPNYAPGFDLNSLLRNGSKLTLQNSIIRTLDPNLKAPYSISFNLGVERQLPLGLTGSLTYIYARGVHQFRSRNINAPLPEKLIGIAPGGDISPARPDPTQGNIFQIETSASSIYQGLRFGVNRMMSRRFTIFGNYSLSFASNDSDGALSSPADNYNLAAEWGPSAMNQRHMVFIGSRVTLPKGITLSPMIMASSGRPFNLTLGQDLNRDTSFNDRPTGLTRNTDLSASLYSQITQCRTSQLDPVTNRPVCAQTYGQYLASAFPNGVRAIGPGSLNVNLNVSRTWGIGKRSGNNVQAGQGGGMGGRGPGGMGGPGMGGGMRGGGGFGGPGMGGGFGGGGAEGARFTVQLSASITNLLNRVNFSQYSGTLTSPYFNLANSAGAARQFEMSLRFGF